MVAMTATNRIVTFSVEIDRRPEDVFAYLSDIMRHGEWSPTPFSIEALTPGPVAVGSRYRSTGMFLGRRMTDEVRIIGLDPSSRFEFVVSTKMRGSFRHTFLLSPTENGTHVDRVIEAPVQRGMAWVVEPVLSPLFIRPRARQTLRLLKRRLETNQDAASQAATTAAMGPREEAGER
jgi:hypothetical protein